MPLGSCLVRVNLTALVIDGVDADDHPDSVPLSATLALEPMVKPGKMLQYNDAGVAKLKALTRIEVEIGPLGDIVDRDRNYVKVPAPDATTTNMSELQWRAKFENVKYGAKTVQVDDIFFYAVPGGEINLADHINVAPSSTAVQIIRGPRGYGVVDVQNDAGDLVFYAGPEDDPTAQSEVGRVAAPSANVTNSSVAPLVSTTGPTRDAVDARAKAVGDQNYAPLWRPNTAYTTGAPVVAPSGDVVTAKTDFTSGATYDAANWNPPAVLTTATGRAIAFAVAGLG